MMALRADPSRLFAHRLALANNRLDVDAMLDELTADQFADWQAFEMLEPFGWPAIQMAVRRMVWASLQCFRSERIDELPFMTQAAAMRTPEQQRIRDEIDALKHRVRVEAAMAEQK